VGEDGLGRAGGCRARGHHPGAEHHTSGAYAQYRSTVVRLVHVTDPGDTQGCDIQPFCVNIPCTFAIYWK
jgi:hypothetical protein